MWPNGWKEWAKRTCFDSFQFDFYASCMKLLRHNGPQNNHFSKRKIKCEWKMKIHKFMNPWIQNALVEIFFLFFFFILISECPFPFFEKKSRSISWVITCYPSKLRGVLTFMDQSIPPETEVNNYFVHLQHKKPIITLNKGISLVQKTFSVVTEW